MTRILERCKLQIIFLICFGCLFLGLSTADLSVYAKEKSPYYIKINKLQNCVTIYEQDEDGNYTVPVKAMTCSTGTDTPLGTFKTLEKYRWKLLMGDVWGQYSTRIVKGVLFHSVWYYKMDASTLSATQYNKLGSAASHGCVRLTVADAKWIYDNCKIGTTVEIYSDKDPGPLGKPDTITLPSGTGWDPTDPSKENPFNDDAPVITGASNKSIEWGAKLNLLKGVKASSTAGTDITSKLKVSGKVDVYKAGKYKVTYSATDAIGRSIKKSVTVTVKKCLEEPRFEGIADRSINMDTVVDRSFALKGVAAYLSTKKLPAKDIKVDIVQNKDHSYSINYSVTGDNGLTGNASAIAYIDTMAPVMEGIAHREITPKQLKSGRTGIRAIALQGVTVKDDFASLSTDDVKVSVQALSDYGYILTYSLSDDAGNTTTETVQFTCFKDTKIAGVRNHYNIPYGTEITEEYVRQGVTASNSSGDCTDELTVGIGKKSNEKYEVIYYIKDKSGNTISVVAYYFVAPEPDSADNTDALEDETANVDTGNADTTEDTGSETEE